MPTNPQPLEDRRAAKLCEECAISEQNGEESEEEAPTRERERDVGVKAWVGGGGGELCRRALGEASSAAAAIGGGEERSGVEAKSR